jgi:predicted nucleotidyltransferase
MPTLSKSPQVDINFVAAFNAKVEQFDPKAKVLLFGSRARRDHRYDSDYDLLILSQKFSGLSPEARWQLVQTKLKPKGFDAVLEPHCYTPTEWQQMHNQLLYAEVMRDGMDFKTLTK